MIFKCPLCNSNAEIVLIPGHSKSVLDDCCTRPSYPIGKKFTHHTEHIPPLVSWKCSECSGSEPGLITPCKKISDEELEGLNKIDFNNIILGGL